MAIVSQTTVDAFMEANKPKTLTSRFTNWMGLAAPPQIPEDWKKTEVQVSVWVEEVRRIGDMGELKAYLSQEQGECRSIEGRLEGDRNTMFQIVYTLLSIAAAVAFSSGVAIYITGVVPLIAASITRRFSGVNETLYTLRRYLRQLGWARNQITLPNWSTPTPEETGVIASLGKWRPSGPIRLFVPSGLNYEEFSRSPEAQRSFHGSSVTALRGEVLLYDFLALVGPTYRFVFVDRMSSGISPLMAIAVAVLIMDLVITVRTWFWLGRGR